MRRRVRAARQSVLPRAPPQLVAAPRRRCVSVLSMKRNDSAARERVRVRVRAPCAASRPRRRLGGARGSAVAGASARTYECTGLRTAAPPSALRLREPLLKVSHARREHGRHRRLRASGGTVAARAHGHTEQRRLRRRTIRLKSTSFMSSRNASATPPMSRHTARPMLRVRTSAAGGCEPDQAQRRGSGAARRGYRRCARERMWGDRRSARAWRRWRPEAHLGPPRTCARRRRRRPGIEPCAARRTRASRTHCLKNLMASSLCAFS